MAMTLDQYLGYKGFTQNDDGNYQTPRGGEDGYQGLSLQETTNYYNQNASSPFLGTKYGETYTPEFSKALHGTAGYIAPDLGTGWGMGGGRESLAGLDEFYASQQSTDEEGRVQGTATKATPEALAARAAFEAKYPGYRQVSPEEVRFQNGQIGLKQAGPSVGRYIEGPFQSQVKYDPEFGYVVPVRSGAVAGGKGGGYGPLLAMAAMAFGAPYLTEALAVGGTAAAGTTAAATGAELAAAGNWAALDAMAGVVPGATYGAEAAVLGAGATETAITLGSEAPWWATPELGGTFAAPSALAGSEAALGSLLPGAGALSLSAGAGIAEGIGSGGEWVSGSDLAQGDPWAGGATQAGAPVVEMGRQAALGDMLRLGGIGSFSGLNNGSTALQALQRITSGQGGANDYLSMVGPAMSIGSGIYGMSQADQLRKRSEEAARTANPWGTSGGQNVAIQQLMALMQNPGSLMSDPGYKARMMGVERQNAKYGAGSGNMAVAAANASGDYYGQRLMQLGQLAGAPGNPGGAAQIGLGGYQAANQLTGQSLASIGYGVNSAIGGSATMSLPPAVRQWMLSQGMVA